MYLHTVRKRTWSSLQYFIAAFILFYVTSADGLSVTFGTKERDQKQDLKNCSHMHKVVHVSEKVHYRDIVATDYYQ